jgi:hypothetical protein
VAKRFDANIKLDLARLWTNADDMKWKATRLLPESGKTAIWPNI